MKNNNLTFDIIFFAAFLSVGTVAVLLNHYIESRVITFGIVVFLSVIGFVVLRMTVIRPIEELTSRSQAVLEGDLTEEVAVKAIGAIGVLSNSVNSMTERLRNLVITIKGDAKGLTEAATTLSAAANQSEKATQELASALEEASASTQEQSTNTEELQATFEELGAAIEEIAASAEQASSAANKAIQTSQDGGDAVENVAERLTLVEGSTQTLQNVISRLDASSQQISEMVHVITHMADQTNLLALNAAIEAARAGEHGRGFAVVADEVRKLAEESASAAQNIIQIVSDNQKVTEQAVNDIVKVREEVAASQELADKAKASLAIIMNSSREINQNSVNIAAAIEQQEKAIQTVMKSVDAIAGASEQIASGSQQANAAVEEQVATANMINESSSNLQTLAEELEELVGTFKTGT